MPLKDIIIDNIKTNGPISFHDYMEAALYYPNEGYYTSPREKIGKAGDYYTSPYLTCIFGEMIAVQLEELWNLLGRNKMTVVEYGAGQGLLAKDILRQLQKNSLLYDHVQYIIIEKSAEMIKLQRRFLPEKVAWVECIEAIGPFDGCVLANEVLDNFAIHQVIMKEELMEVYVDFDDGLKETLKPASKQLTDYLAAFEISLPYGHRAEINLQAIEWIRAIAATINTGAVITIDYGYGAKELYSPTRKDGTLLCYCRHNINDEFYKDPGGQDITAHVNFSALKFYGEKFGLQFGGFTNQAQFLLSLGLSNHIASQGASANGNGQMIMLQRLLMDMGRKMKVLTLQKGFQQPLRGMQFPLSLI